MALSSTESESEENKANLVLYTTLFGVEMQRENGIKNLTILREVRTRMYFTHASSVLR